MQKQRYPQQHGGVRTIYGRRTWVDPYHLRYCDKNTDNSGPELKTMIKNNFSLTQENVSEYIILLVLIYTTDKRDYVKKDFLEVIRRKGGKYIDKWNTFVRAMSAMASERNSVINFKEPCPAGEACICNNIGCMIRNILMNGISDIRVPCIYPVTNENTNTIELCITPSDIRIDGMRCRFNHSEPTRFDDDDIEQGSLEENIYNSMKDAIINYTYAAVNGVSYATFILDPIIKDPKINLDNVREYAEHNFTSIISVFMAANYFVWSDPCLMLPSRPRDVRTSADIRVFLEDAMVQMGNMSIKYADVFTEYPAKLAAIIVSEQ